MKKYSSFLQTYWEQWPWSFSLHCWKKREGHDCHYTTYFWNFLFWILSIVLQTRWGNIWTPFRVINFFEPKVAIVTWWISIGGSRNCNIWPIQYARVQTRLETYWQKEIDSYKHLLRRSRQSFLVLPTGSSLSCCIQIDWPLHIGYK